MENINNSLSHCNTLIKKINVIIRALEDKDIIFNNEDNQIISADLEKADMALSSIEDIIIKNLRFGIKETLSKNEK